MLEIALVMTVATAVGVYASKRRPEQADRAARNTMDFVLWVLLPVVLFFMLVRFEFTAEIGLALGIGLAANVVVVGLAYVIGTHVLHASRAVVGTIMACSVLGNTAYLGYPFVAAALGFDELPVAASYDIMVMVPTFLLVGFSIGAAFGTVAESSSDRIRSFFTRNPLIYAAIAAFVAPDSFAPDVAVDGARLLVFAILPLGFFAVGVTLHHEAEEDELSFPPPLTPPVAVAVVLKLTVPAAIFLLASAFIVHIPRAYIIEAAMPTGVNNLLIANTYGLDRKLAASAIVWSTPIVLLAGLAAEFL